MTVADGPLGAPTHSSVQAILPFQPSKQLVPLSPVKKEQGRVDVGRGRVDVGRGRVE